MGLAGFDEDSSDAEFFNSQPEIDQKM